MKTATFSEAYAVAKSHTLVSESRCRALWLVAGMTAKIPGSIVELGTFKGGTLYLLAAAAAGRKVFSIDTFGGMPDRADPSVDVHRAGEFHETSLDRVRRLIAPFPHAAALQMTFPDGLAQQPIEGPISMAHFDGDIYSSCVAFLDFVLPRLSPGGVIVFDDYRWEKCPGVEKAIEERGLEVIWAMANQAVWVNR